MNQITLYFCSFPDEALEVPRTSCFQIGRLDIVMKKILTKLIDKSYLITIKNKNQKFLK